MPFSQILFDVDAAGIALITINRPTKLNALNRAVLEELESAFDRVATDANARAAIITGAGDKAFVEYQKILAEKPDDPDANLGAGLAHYSTGEKAKYQEAANYLQRFVDKAPDTHKDKEGVKAVLVELKNTENVVPERSTPARRKSRRRYGYVPAGRRWGPAWCGRRRAPQPLRHRFRC